MFARFSSTKHSPRPPQFWPICFLAFATSVCFSLTAALFRCSVFVAQETFDDAQKHLQQIIKGKSLTANAVFGLFPANSEGDDIVVYEDESRTKEKARLHTLRQQVAKEV